MVYFNYIAMGLICVFILIAALVKKRRPLSERFGRLIESRRFEIVFIAVLLIVTPRMRRVSRNDKMERKELTRDEAIIDILKTSTKTRKSINTKFGLE